MKKVNYFSPGDIRETTYSRYVCICWGEQSEAEKLYLDTNEQSPRKWLHNLNHVVKESQPLFSLQSSLYAYILIRMKNLIPYLKALLLSLLIIAATIVAYSRLVPHAKEKSGSVFQRTGAVTATTATPTGVQTGSQNPLTVIAHEQARADGSSSVSNTSLNVEACSASSPYGFTTPQADANLVSLYAQMNVCWVRYQIPVEQIETAPQVYNWSTLDAVVAQMNAAGIHIDVPIQCFQGPCFTNPSIPTPAQMAQFAGQIATRYNGKNGHGYIDAFEIGNEEYDANSSFLPQNYGPILEAGYLAIKAASPQALVGMYGTFLSNPNHTTQVLNAIFQGGYGSYMDFMNFHYYDQGLNPMTDADSLHPSFNHKWQLMHSIAAQYGYGNLPIWVTEIGWSLQPLPGRQAVTAQVQAQYLQYVTQQAALSGGIVQKMFWFTINDGSQPDSIYPPGGPLPAFDALKQFVQQNPLW